jgi:hypothetical protein
LELLVETISTYSPDLKVTDRAVMGALILAARRSPVEAISAVVSTYWSREIELAAVIAVCGWIRAHAG